jgi:hypothetical protein
MASRIGLLCTGNYGTNLGGVKTVGCKPENFDGIDSNLALRKINGYLLNLPAEVGRAIKWS